MDAWEAGRHGMLVEKTLWTCEQYHTASCREDSEDNRFKTYHSLVLQGNLQMVARWITDRKKGGTIQPKTTVQSPGR